MGVTIYPAQATPESIGAQRAFLPVGASETFDHNAGDQTSVTAGVVYVSRIYLVPRAYTTVDAVIGDTAANTATNAWVGLYDYATNARVAQADVTATLNATGTYTTLSMALAYTPTAAGEFWVAFLVGAATGLPKLVCAFTNIADSMYSQDGLRHTATGLTALPATLTPVVAANNRHLWFRVRP